MEIGSCQGPNACQGVRGRNVFPQPWVISQYGRQLTSDLLEPKALNFLIFRQQRRVARLAHELDDRSKSFVQLARDMRACAEVALEVARHARFRQQPLDTLCVDAGPKDFPCDGKLGAEHGVNRLVRNLGFRSDVFDSNGAIAAVGEKAAGRVKDPPSRDLSLLLTQRALVNAPLANLADHVMVRVAHYRLELVPTG